LYARPESHGAKSVALVTPTDVALFRDTPGGASLEEVVAALHGTDIVLAEGFHQAPGLKISFFWVSCEEIFTTEPWFENLTTLTHSTLLRVILREIEG